jgi:thiol-disulfide isomerase/thioredoxin
MLFRPILAIVVPVATAMLVGCSAGSPASHLAVGRKAPPLELVSLAEGRGDGEEGEPILLEGRITLLNFWGTWCPPCRRELPGMVRLARRLADEPRFRFVAVSCGTGPRDDLEVIRAETRSFLRERDLEIDAWADPDGRTRFHFASTMDFSAYPTTYLIGPDAVVRRVWVGYRSRDEADIAAAVVEALREVAPSGEPLEQ